LGFFALLQGLEMKLSFDEAIEKISDGRYVKSSDVLASAHNRVVWVAEWHIPGCISESFSICTSKADAIECALFMANNPRGMKTALRQHGRFDSDSPMFGVCINTIERRALGEFLS